MIKITDDEYIIRLDDFVNEMGAGAECGECQYSDVMYQSHPYGNTSATEELWECVCEEPYGCPRLNLLLEED
jgi:hypothetical protein